MLRCIKKARLSAGGHRFYLWIFVGKRNPGKDVQKRLVGEFVQYWRACEEDDGVAFSA